MHGNAVIQAVIVRSYVPLTLLAAFSLVLLLINKSLLRSLGPLTDTHSRRSTTLPYTACSSHYNTSEADKNILINNQEFYPEIIFLM